MNKAKLLKESVNPKQTEEKNRKLSKGVAAIKNAAEHIQRNGLAIGEWDAYPVEDKKIISFAMDEVRARRKVHLIDFVNLPKEVQIVTKHSQEYSFGLNHLNLLWKR